MGITEVAMLQNQLIMKGGKNERVLEAEGESFISNLRQNRAGKVQFGSDSDENEQPPWRAQPQLRFPIARRFRREWMRTTFVSSVLTPLPRIRLHRCKGSMSCTNRSATSSGYDMSLAR
jgi:hypothetical protein